MRIDATLTVVTTLIASAANALPTATISVDTPKGPAKFRVEIAADSASQERGLMFRKSLAPDAGMLFDFRQPVMTSFWMKNTPLSLDIIFIRPDGTISSVAANAVPYSEASIPSSEPIRAVLEIGGGRAATLGISPGEVVHARIFDNAR
jgi:uncharacterized membrane protein (UPF0127 family)